MNQLTTTKSTALSSFAERFKIDPSEMENTLKKTVFKQSGDKEITNEQMVMLMVVADQYNLNPFTKEIYAFPDKQGGVVPVVGIDGWSRLINSNKHFDGMEFNQSETIVMADDDAKPCPEWMEVVLYRDDRSRPIVVREYLDECYRPAFKKQNSNYVNKGPWQTHTKRLLRHKAMIQGARIAFGFAGIYDDDEAERILETNRDAIEGEYDAVEPVKGIAPVQSKAESISGVIAKRIKRGAVKAPPSDEIKEVEPDVKETQPDVTPRGKASLKGKITKCKDIESLQLLHSDCMEFHGSEYFDDLTKAFSTKKVELENG